MNQQSDQIEEREFTCPECGSHMFGSSDCHDSSKMMGHCHGPNGCRFSWPRSDDHKYFKGTGMFRPSQEMAACSRE